ncbi:MAG: type IV pilus modification protein PilV [Steroidobacteraceae bacterium]
MNTDHNSRRAGRTAAPMAGFTLIEVLVAMVILSVGLLGVAKLSLSTVQGNGSAFMRSQANELVQQIVDNMRANQPQAVAHAYDIAIGAMPGAAPDCTGGACSDTQVTTFDLSNWKARLAANLPSGDGQIVTTTTVNPTTLSPETTAVITVQWDDSVAQWAFGTPSTVVPAPMSITVETLL